MCIYVCVYINTYIYAYVFICTHTIPPYKMKEKTPLTITAKNVKCLGINLIRNIQSLYEENFKMFLQNLKVDLNK